MTEFVRRKKDIFLEGPWILLLTQIIFFGFDI